MKLFRFRDNGNVKPGIVDQSGISRDASSIVSDWSGESLSDNFIKSIDNSKLSTDTKLGNHFNPSKSTHLNEANQETFDLQTYKKFLSFLKFQEMMDKYNN